MRLPLSTLACAILSVTINIGTGSAQQADRAYKVVSLRTGEAGLVVPPIEKWTGPGGAYRDALRDSGFVAGKNLTYEARHADGEVARLAAVASSIVASKPDVIMSFGTAATVAATRATKTIPIVFSGLGGPVEKGIVASLSKPGGNVTGTAAAIGNPRMWQLIRDVAPSTRHGGMVIYGPNNANDRGPQYWEEFLSRYRRDAATAGIELVDLTINSRDELEPKLAELATRGDAALYVVTDPVLFSWRSTILEMASRHRLPTVCAQWLEWGAAGCVAEQHGAIWS